MDLKKLRKSKLGTILIKLNLGKYKAWYQRVALYITAINFLMIFYGFTQTNNWLPWFAWLFVFIFVVVSILFIDILFIWESEQDTTASKNPKIMEILENQQRLENKFDKLSKLITLDDDYENETDDMLPDIPVDSHDIVRNETRNLHSESETDSYIQ